ncbi:MAG: hypothetical protein NWE98_12170 [Candidatus Bathyarchaeota archaeon]|nr:hypothetical protein [Candidatus Bathyarchaeota archaeon]
MRRIVALAILLALSILVGIEAIGVVVANPFGMAKQIDTPSDAKPPIISINSPQNNTDYSGSFNISFNIKTIQYYAHSAIVDVIYTLDNETVTIPHQYWVLAQGPGVCQYSTSIIAPTLPAGNHSLKIRAQGASYDFYNFFLIDAYSQVYFTVSDNSTKTNPTNQATATDALESKTAFSLPTLPLMIAIISVIVIITVASVSLVSLKKRRE